MINVSSAFREALSNDNRAYIERAVITLEDSTVLELGNEQLWGGGFDTDDSVSADDSFSALGSAVVNSATLVINNIYDDFSEYVFENAEAVLYIGLELDGNVESIRKGTYIVDGAQYNGSIITLSLLDNMYHFDRPYSESTLEYPATCDTIIRDACTVCGVPIGSASFQYRDTVIDERPTDEAITFREIIAYVAQICGCYARCNINGALELKWFDTDSLEDQTASVYHIDSIYSSDMSMDDVVITGVRATYEVTIDGKDETLTYMSGIEGYVIEIDKNPMITGVNVLDIIDRLGVQLIGLRFRKANVSHSSDPTLEAGDVAILDDRKGNSYPILITRTKFKVGASQNTVCGAETPARKSSARYSENTKNYVEIRKKINRQKDAFDRALEELAERIDDADGMFTTQVQTQSGGTITYLHNKPLLTESDIQIMISSVGVTVTSNGTDEHPTWYGLTVDGNMITNILNTVGINASWINTGQLVITKDGTEIFFADVDTGTVRISGNSIRITAGDALDTAIASRASQTTRTIMDNAGAYGLGWKINASTFSGTNDGECYFHGYDTDGTEADINGWVQWNGKKVTIPKGCHINPNSTMPFNTDIYSVYRTSNSTWNDVCWDKTNKQWVGITYTGTSPSAQSTWTWDDDTDIVIASYRIPAAEGAIYSAQLYTPPKKHTELAEAAYEYAEDGLASLESQVNASIKDIQDQLDGVVDQFFYDYDPRPNANFPSLQNYPTSSWQASEYPDHEGDMFLDTSTGVSYRWVNENSTWYWKEIPDSAATQALQMARQAKDTADGKRRVFVSTPNPPYDVGDIWMGGANGDILTCTTAKAAGASFATTDFEKLNKYGEGDALYLETPFEWSQDGKTANFAAIIYKDDVDITNDYPNSWFEWTLRTENGETKIATGKTCSVSKSSLGYGGTVTCTFTTYETATLTTRSLKALNTRSGLTLTTYVATEGTQPVSELPIKTATQVDLNDYIMGIDSADGYQVTVQNLATRMATGVLDARYDARYVKLTGDTMTGVLVNEVSNSGHVFCIKNTNIDRTVSTGAYQESGHYTFYDKNNALLGYVNGFVDASGNVGIRILGWADINGTNTYNGLSLGVKTDGSAYVGLSANATGAAAAWRTAIGAVNKAGDTMTGVLTIQKNADPYVATKHSDSAQIGVDVPSETIQMGRHIMLDSTGTSCGWVTVYRTAADHLYTSIVSRRKNASGTILHNDLNIGVDASGNLTVSVSSPAAWRGAIGAVNKAGDVMTGQLTARFSTFDLSKANNGVSSTLYPTTFNIEDSAGRITTRLEGVIKSDGTVSSYWYLRNYNTSGTQVAQKGIQMTMAKDGTLTYTVSDGAKFRSAIGVYSTSECDTRYVNISGDTMTGNLTASKDAPCFIAKHTGVNVAATNNGRSATTWYGMPIRDNADRTLSAFYGFAQADGIVGAGLWVYSHNTSGSQTAGGALRIFINKSGTIGYSVDNAAAFRSAIAAVNKAGDTMTGNLTVQRSASGDTGFYFNRTDTGISGFVGVGSGGTNHGVWSNKLGKWIIYADASNVYVSGMNFTNAASARASIGAAAKDWTEIATVKGTNSATYSLTAYKEILLMIWYGGSYNYMGTAVLPLSAIGSTQYEMYVGGWGNMSTSSNRVGCAKVSNNKLTGVMVRIDNQDVTSNSYFRLYAR